MDFLIALGAVLFLCAACLGYGAFTLRLVRVLGDLSPMARLTWAFPVGLGTMGWILFFPASTGFLSVATLVATGGLGIVALVTIKESARGSLEWKKPDIVGWLLFVPLFLILAVDLLEGLSPPSDADTLAYHFLLPKRHLAEGILVAIPRALDGMPPQLLHMSYTAALGLGGEKALTLWTMVTGWATAALLYELCRRYIGQNWSLAVAIVYLATPVVLQTGGAGYVEPRIAQFVLIAAIAAGIAIHRHQPEYAALSGICAGFFAASKYTGLLLCVVGGIVMLLGKGRWRRTGIFCICGFVAGAQWYAWIWWQTGDPVFPMLYDILGASPGLWSEMQNEIFRRYIETVETPLSISVWQFLAFPFYITFVANSDLENVRTGLGVLPILLLPFAIAWLYKGWGRDCRSPLFIAGLMMLLFLAFWFFSGSPQRVRHLLPIYPVVLLCFAVAAVRCADRWSVHGPLAAAFILCIGLYSAGQAYFGVNFAKYIFSGEIRTAFLKRNIPSSSMVAWFNDNHKPGDKILVFDRELLFLFDMPVVMSHSALQNRFNFPRAADRPERIYRELRSAGISHILVPVRDSPNSAGDLSTSHKALQKIFDAGCMNKIRQQKIVQFGSRTVRTGDGSSSRAILYRFDDRTCRLTS
jgi:hypothetical protein